MFRTKFLETIRTYFMFSNFFSPPENLAFYEIMCKSTVELDRPQMTIRRVHIACWIPEATHTHSEYVILIAFPLQLVAQATSMLRYTYIARLVTNPFS